MTPTDASTHVHEIAEALAGLRQCYADRGRLQPWDVEWLEFRIAALEHEMAIVNTEHPAPPPAISRRTRPAPSGASRQQDR